MSGDNIALSALREANGEAMTSTAGIEDSFPQGIPMAKRSKIPTRAHITSINTVLNKKLPTDFNMTNGQFKTLTTWTGTDISAVTSTNRADVVLNATYNSPLAIPLNYFLGQPSANSLTENSGHNIITDDFLYEIGNTDWQHYIFIKFKKLYMKMKNFTINVERGTAGGVQFLTDFTWILREIPAIPAVRVSNRISYDGANPAVTANSYIPCWISEPKVTDLTKGISWEWNAPRDAWIPIYRLFTAPINTAGTRLVRWKNIVELCNPDTFNIDANSPTSFIFMGTSAVNLPHNPFMPLNELDTIYQLRLATPILGGDIVLHLGYELEVGAEIDCMFKYNLHTPLYPIHGSTTSSLLIGKKRLIEETELDDWENIKNDNKQKIFKSLIQ